MNLLLGVECCLLDAKFPKSISRSTNGLAGAALKSMNVNAESTFQWNVSLAVLEL